MSLPAQNHTEMTCAPLLGTPFNLDGLLQLAHLRIVLVPKVGSCQAGIALDPFGAQLDDLFGICHGCCKPPQGSQRCCPVAEVYLVPACSTKQKLRLDFRFDFTMLTIKDELACIS